jgi:hypothetical protein
MTSQEYQDPTMNENWTICQRCGAPVLVNPNTRRPEACSNCNAEARRLGLLTRGTFMLIGLAATVLLVAFAISLLV